MLRQRIIPLVIMLSCAGALARMPVAARAESFTFASYTWDQANSPNAASLLGNGAILGGATFSSGVPYDVSNDVGFPDRQAGQHATSTFSTALTLGRLTSLSTVANTARALNLPGGDNGSSVRQGVQVGWSDNRYLLDGSGVDFVIYESASNSTTPENPMVRVRRASDQTYSDWFYFAPDAFQNYVSDVTQGAFATGFDIADFGLGANIGVDLIQIANLTTLDRIAGTQTYTYGGQAFGEGRVVFDSSSLMKPDAGAYASFRNSGYGGTTLDPDPLYVAVTAAVVPEPASLTLLGVSAVLIGLGSLRRSAKKKLSVAGV